MSERTDLLLAIADDELILGWRNSEWTGIAPFLEEDVAFSSIAQNEIGHARALYELAAAELGTTADELAFDRPPEEYRCGAPRPAAPPRMGAHDRPPLALRDAQTRSGWPRSRPPTTRRSRASRRRWTARRRTTGCTPRCGSTACSRPTRAVSASARPSTSCGRTRSGVLDDALRPELVARAQEKLGRALPDVEPIARGVHEDELAELWEEMTSVRRSAPAGAQW